MPDCKRKKSNLSTGCTLRGDLVIARDDGRLTQSGPGDVEGRRLDWKSNAQWSLRRPSHVCAYARPLLRICKVGIGTGLGGARQRRPRQWTRAPSANCSHRGCWLDGMATRAETAVGEHQERRSGANRVPAQLVGARASAFHGLTWSRDDERRESGRGGWRWGWERIRARGWSFRRPLRRQRKVRKVLV